MHHDLKHFYECVIDMVNCDCLKYDYRYVAAYKRMRDTHPHCEELLDTFAELAIELYNHSDGPAAQALAEEMNRIEQTLDSCRVPF